MTERRDVISHEKSAMKQQQKTTSKSSTALFIAPPVSEETIQWQSVMRPSHLRKIKQNNQATPKWPQQYTTTPSTSAFTFAVSYTTPKSTVDIGATHRQQLINGTSQPHVLTETLYHEPTRQTSKLSSNKETPKPLFKTSSGSGFKSTVPTINVSHPHLNSTVSSTSRFTSHTTTPSYKTPVFATTNAWSSSRAAVEPTWSSSTLRRTPSIKTVEATTTRRAGGADTSLYKPSSGYVGSEYGLRARSGFLRSSQHSSSSREHSRSQSSMEGSNKWPPATSSTMAPFSHWHAKETVAVSTTQTAVKRSYTYSFTKC